MVDSMAREWASILDAWQRMARAPLSLALPLSGNVAQEIGLINIDNSSDPELEGEIVARVASYGKQLGRVLDALSVLIEHPTPAERSDEDRQALEQLCELHDQVVSVKQDRGRNRVERVLRDIEALKRSDTGSVALDRIRHALEA